MTSKSVLVLALAAVGVFGVAGSAAATPAAGVKTTILAKSTVPALNLRAHGHDWGVRIKTRGVSDGYVVDNVLAPGATTGWHSHPGPSLIFVVRGTVTNYESDEGACDGKAYAAGTSFVDRGGRDVHMLRNDGDVEAETIAVQLVPADAPRRIDAAAPDDCGS